MTTLMSQIEQVLYSDVPNGTGSLAGRSVLVQLILARFFLPAADEVDPRGFTLGGLVSASLMLIVF